MTPDMLREQFEYLMTYHNGQCAVRNCPDCLRMSVIDDLLNRPFENPADRGEAA